MRRTLALEGAQVVILGILWIYLYQGLVRLLDISVKAPRFISGEHHSPIVLFADVAFFYPFSPMNS